ncbi:MAG: Gfo/Idh/MocA family oxidoreductase [Candidatus Sumerlaeota bacterium]|nr:Gfo/Idh/MocA family oxidoreductase [Candidatus Sumerlaeota bacterium]
MSKQSKLRLGIIGVGGMGREHSRIIREKVTRCELTAVCDIDPRRREFFPGLTFFERSEELIRSGLVDAVLIATPHYFHTTIGIDALEQGLHVLVEKPISVHKADCERLIAAHKRRGQVFAAMFNQRTDPHYIRIKRLIEQGELGAIQRVNWIITDWFRTEAYYRSGGWRATWKGEGGGVLLNQCPHNLDLLQWLCGMPKRVRAFCALGKYHDIEVEDEVTAYMEYANGATAVFATTTGEAPGANRLEIAGDRGKVVCESGKVTFIRNEMGAKEFCKTSKESFATPQRWNIDIPIAGNGSQHAGIEQNFVDAILDGAPLIAPAREGIRSVELANAMLYSSLLGKTVELPLDGKAYERKLKQLIAGSKTKKKVVEQKSVEMGKSFGKA